MTVNELRKLLHALQVRGEIGGNTEIILSSDEEGNCHNTLEGYDIYKKKLILVPSHEEAFI